MIIIHFGVIMCTELFCTCYLLCVTFRFVRYVWSYFCRQFGNADGEQYYSLCIINSSYSDCHFWYVSWPLLKQVFNHAATHYLSSYRRLRLNGQSLHLTSRKIAKHFANGRCENLCHFYSPAQINVLKNCCPATFHNDCQPFKDWHSL